MMMKMLSQDIPPRRVIVLIAGLLFVFGIWIRFPWLHQPDRVIFDEVYYGKFASSYCCTHEYVFDLHPPHGKLLVALPLMLTQYDGKFDWSKSDASFREAGVPIRLMRGVPAVFGASIGMLAFLLIMRLGFPIACALLVGIFATWDNALVIQTKLFLLDGIILASILAALLFYISGADARTYGRRRLLFACAGGFAALAAGSKLTGLSAMGVICLHGAYTLLRAKRHSTEAHTSRAEMLWSSAWIFAGFFVVYFAGWALHEGLLVSSAYAGSMQHPWDIVTRFFERVMALHVRIVQTHATMLATHSYASKPIGWPVGHRPIYYWVEGEARNYMQANIFVWWSAAVAVVVTIVAYTLRAIGVVATSRAGQMLARLKGTRDDAWIFIAFGYLLSYVPNFFMSRQLLMYQYLPSLGYALLALAPFALMTNIAKPASLLRQPKHYYAVCLTAIAMFYVFLPFTYPVAWGQGLRETLWRIFPWK